jgi:uncharacterized repeat protein (TIGR01451 family)
MPPHHASAPLQAAVDHPVPQAVDKQCDCRAAAVRVSFGRSPITPGLVGCACRLLSLLALAAVAALPFAGSAQAAAPSPGWTLDSFAMPTSFTTSDNARCVGTLDQSDLLCDAYQVTASNAGAQPTNGDPVTLTDALPAGLEAQKVSFFWSGSQEDLGSEDCSVTLVRCAFPGTVAPDQTLKMLVYVTVLEAVPDGPIANVASISGGGAAPVSISQTNQIASSSPPFGLTNFASLTAGPDGVTDAQAGDRPYELTITGAFASLFRETAEGSFAATSVVDPRDILIDLPPGLAGSALSTPVTCTFAELSGEAAGNEKHSDCPNESIVGFIRTSPATTSAVRSFLYNMVPERGAVAEFGYVDPLNGAHVLYASIVPSPEGYVVRTTGPEIPEATLTGLVVNVYGDPAARDGSSVEAKERVPTFTNPADCDGKPLVTSIHMDSWHHPGTYNAAGEPNLGEPNWVTSSSAAEHVNGCNKLAGLFKPMITATPSTNQGDSPTGLEVDLKVPQQQGTETLATPPLKKAVVILPEGMTVNPSSANGLEACSLAALGISASGEPNAAPPNCPEASKIGTIELETPALPGVLEGQIYVAKQSENPFHSLLALYLVVSDPKTGVLVKIPGEIKADPATGQLTTVIDNSPQFPFTELRTKFQGGQKAALRTPAVCGTYKVTSSLTPWSAPESGPPATPAGTFKIVQGCANSAVAEPNKPSFNAGTLSLVAGAYSPFVLELSREDGSQQLQGLALTLPPGLLGKLAGVAECPEADIAAARAREHEGGGAQEQASPSCPASSEVGIVTVGAGVGLTPYYATGHAYLAGPYKGAPLSLAIVTPAVVGPFDLGDIVVRVALQVNPETAQVTARSDPIPAVIHGIPLDLRSIALSLNRPGFSLNPTSCEKMAVSGEALSVLGQSAPLSNPFQVGECPKLGFRPKLSLRFFGPTHRGAHPGFRTVLTAGKGEASLGRLAVTLPGTELLDNTHIAAICTGAQFAAGQCPAGSIYGHAKAWTPLLDRPLEGPVYLRSSNRKLPDLVASLGGQIHLDLTAHVDSVHGRLRDTFAALPDAPLSKLVWTMQGGSKGLLVNTGHFCARQRRTSTVLDAQTGKVREIYPPIKAACGKHR